MSPPRIRRPAGEMMRRIGRTQDPYLTRPILIEENDPYEVKLPKDLPAWRRDRRTISARARALLARIKPILIRVFTFWDHQVTLAHIDGRWVEIDATGSYLVR